MNPDDLYREAKKDRLGFWAKQAERLAWFEPWHTVLDWQRPYAKWYVGGKLNACYNCLDRHVTTEKKNKAALIWEGERGEMRCLTYWDLFREVQKFANVLKSLGIKKGDCIAIYMPLIPEAVIAMLASARVGAVHTVVFGGFSKEALKDRINDAEAKLVITADGGFRKGTLIRLKSAADLALEETPTCQKMIVVKHAECDVGMRQGRDHWYHELMHNASQYAPPEVMEAEDRLFILYTSGTTGKPKGVVHTTGGYMVGAHVTTEWVFGIRPEDVYWCTADIGWITGHSYVVYGPLSCGATVFMYEGSADYPSYKRMFELIEKYGVSIFYTAPTLIRTFMKWGEEWPKSCNLSSLRLLGTVGEPINPEAWNWYSTHIGGGRCPIVDTWWQTETGSIMISPIPGYTPLRDRKELNCTLYEERNVPDRVPGDEGISRAAKAEEPGARDGALQPSESVQVISLRSLKPGSATRPLPGFEAEVLNEEGSATKSGLLAILEPWPSMLRGIHNDPERYVEAYWKRWQGRYYFTGDGCTKDDEGDFWLTGRVDDVMNVSGHRISSTEVESALVDFQGVAEAAVIGAPHPIKGQAIYAFVSLKSATKKSPFLEEELKTHVSELISPICKPERIIFTQDLPKTRSGKIMRRLLRDIAEGKLLGDISTLANIQIVEEIRQKYQED